MQLNSCKLGQEKRIFNFTHINIKCALRINSIRTFQYNITNLSLLSILKNILCSFEKLLCDKLFLAVQSLKLDPN